MPDQPRPTLGEAVAARLTSQQTPNADAERQFLARLDADAKLHGTPAYDALPAEYRARIEARALEVARTTTTGQGGQE